MKKIYNQIYIITKINNFQNTKVCLTYLVNIYLKPIYIYRSTKILNQNIGDLYVFGNVQFSIYIYIIHSIKISN